jgi:hypothetical protein
MERATCTSNGWGRFKGGFPRPSTSLYDEDLAICQLSFSSMCTVMLSLFMNPCLLYYDFPLLSTCELGLSIRRCKFHQDSRQQLGNDIG